MSTSKEQRHRMWITWSLKLNFWTTYFLPLLYTSKFCHRCYSMFYWSLLNIRSRVAFYVSQSGIWFVRFIGLCILILLNFVIFESLHKEGVGRLRVGALDVCFFMWELRETFSRHSESDHILRKELFIIAFRLILWKINWVFTKSDKLSRK